MTRNVQTNQPRPHFRLDISRIGAVWTYMIASVGEIPANSALILGDFYDSWISAEAAAFHALPRPCVVEYTDENLESWIRGLN